MERSPPLERPACGDTEEDESQLGLNNLHHRLREERDSSPLGGSFRDLRLSGKMCWQDTDSESEYGNPEELHRHHTAPDRWRPDAGVGVKFIDDISAAVKCDVTGAQMFISTQKERRIIHARDCQVFFENVKNNCERRGMRVNDGKTQLLCISTAINYDVRAEITAGESNIQSADTLKIVGFTFGRRPGAAAHVDALRRNYGARAHVIRHLKQNDIDQDTLVKVYCSLIRPIFEFAIPAFHTLLTDEQSEALERMQRQSLKTIFGWKVPYSSCLEKAGIETLKQRREALFNRFTHKAFESDRYNERWFTPHQRSSYGLRKENLVVQKFAYRDRLKNAPCYKMREIINQEARGT